MGSTPTTSIANPTRGTVYTQPAGDWVTPVAGGFVEAGATCYDANGAYYNPGTLTVTVWDETTNTEAYRTTVNQNDLGGSFQASARFSPTVSGHVYSANVSWDSGPTYNFVGPARLDFAITSYSDGGGGGLTNIHIRRSGAWTTASAVKVRRSGAWTNASAVWVRRSGAWTKVWG